MLRRAAEDRWAHCGVPLSQAPPLSHREHGGPPHTVPTMGAEPWQCWGPGSSMPGALRWGLNAGWAACHPPPLWGRSRVRGGGIGPRLPLQQLFPLRNLKRISIFLPNRASKLCCEQFGNSRRVSGSLAPAPKPVHILSCLMWTPHSRPELMLLLFVWTWWVQTRLIEMRMQFPLDNGRADS